MGSSQIATTESASRLINDNDVANAALLGLCQLLLCHFFADYLLDLG